MATETWMDVKGYEGAYQVSNLGRVKSLARKVLTTSSKWMNIKERILKPQKNTYGFLTATFYQENVGTSFSIARLVLSTFTGINPADTHYAAYRNEDHTDCRLENLYWQTHSDANLAKIEKGTMPLGIMGTHPKAKLTEQAVLAIKSRPLKHGEAQLLADALGVSHVTICKVLQNKVWKDIPSYELKF